MSILKVEAMLRNLESQIRNLDAAYHEYTAIDRPNQACAWHFLTEKYQLAMAPEAAVQMLRFYMDQKAALQSLLNVLNAEKRGQMPASDDLPSLWNRP